MKIAPFILYNTIYRAIYRGVFNDSGHSHGSRGAIRKLRHRGKSRHIKTYGEHRGQIPIPHTIHERPLESQQRGSNENIDCLLREYMPKGQDLSQFSNKAIATFAQKINTRPRKCLSWKTPYEVFYQQALHLIDNSPIKKTKLSLNPGFNLIF